MKVRSRSVGAAAVGIALFAGAGLFTSAAAAPDGAKANGGMTYLNTAGQEMHLNFNAQGTTEAAKGHIHFKNPVTGVDFKADVTCIGKFGNQAVINGFTSQGDIDPSAIRVIVIDNGNPGTSDLVRVTRRPAAGGGFTCDRPNTADRPVIHGNPHVSGEDSPVTMAFLPVPPDEQPGDEDL